VPAGAAAYVRLASLLSHDGLATQEISDLIGHHSTAVTEIVCRHQLQPVIEDSAERMQASSSAS
jgi:hypothetical protein